MIGAVIVHFSVHSSYCALFWLIVLLLLVSLALRCEKWSHELGRQVEVNNAEHATAGDGDQHRVQVRQACWSRVEERGNVEQANHCNREAEDEATMVVVVVVVVCCGVVAVDCEVEAQDDTLGNYSTT